MSKAVSSNANENANKLYSATQNLYNANNHLTEVINDLNNGATANRIKFTVTILNTLRSEINEEILLLRNAANDIVSVANSIENENKARSD